MKLLYLVAGEFLSNKESGVGAKIQAKTRALKDSGIDVNTVEFSQQAGQQIDDLCRVIQVTDGKYLAAIYHFLDKEAARFDKILFRYPFADKALLEIIKRHGSKIFFEHNTFEIEEAVLVQQRHFKTLAFKLSPSYLSYWYKTFVQKKTNEKKLGGEILKYAAGGICVTHELAAYEVKKCPGYKTFVVSNGANDQVEALSVPPHFTNTLKTFMLVGDDAPWQGFERIVEGLRLFKDNSHNIEVNIIGITKLPEEIKGLPKNCKLSFTGPSKNYFTENKLQNYHLAFSTLALYKKGMQEAAALKLRDCMLRGLPVVLAYHDTDVTGNTSFSPYALQFPNDKSPIDFSKILHFNEALRKTGNYPKKIRELAINTFSYPVKAAELKKILETN